MNTPNTEQDAASVVEEDESAGSPLATIGLGAGVLLLTGGLFWYFVQFEASDATRGARMWWPIALAYNLGGKWPPTIILALIGVAGLALGVHQYVTSEKKA